VGLYPVVCGADAMLLCRRRRREQRQDVELDTERESGKKTGKVVDKPELGRESCYLYQNPVLLTYGSTWSERTGYGVQNPVFPSDIRFFLRPVYQPSLTSHITGYLLVQADGILKCATYYDPYVLIMSENVTQGTLGTYVFQMCLTIFVNNGASVVQRMKIGL
jgi:hypothetical protein